MELPVSDARCLARKLTTARWASETALKVPAILQRCLMGATIAAMMLGGAVRCLAQQLTNGTLSVTVNSQDGSYQFGTIGGPSALQASIGALVDHAWLRPGSYPSHSVSESPF